MHRFVLSAYVSLTSHWSEVRNADRERGLTTTEIAVLTFVLVATAVAVGGLLYSYANGRVDALPEDTTPTLNSGGGE